MQQNKRDSGGNNLKRVRPAAATARYFKELTPQASAEEQALAKELNSLIETIDLDSSSE